MTVRQREYVATFWYCKSLFSCVIWLPFNFLYLLYVWTKNWNKLMMLNGWSLFLFNDIAAVFIFNFVRLWGHAHFDAAGYDYYIFNYLCFFFHYIWIEVNFLHWFFFFFFLFCLKKSLMFVFTLIAGRLNSF